MSFQLDESLDATHTAALSVESNDSGAPPRLAVTPSGGTRSTPGRSLAADASAAPSQRTVGGVVLGAGSGSYVRLARGTDALSNNVREIRKFLPRWGHRPQPNGCAAPAAIPLGDRPWADIEEGVNH